MTAATVPVPSPYAIDCAATNDVLSRTLVVRLPETEVGYARLLWREAFAAYSTAEESGWGGNGAETTASRSMRLGTAQGLSLYECPAQVSAFSCQQW